MLHEGCAIYTCRSIVSFYNFRNIFLGEPIILGLCNMALNLENEGYKELADSILGHCQALFPSSLSQFSKVWKSLI